MTEGAKKYRKKPVVVEAFQFDGQNAAMILYWIGSRSLPHAPERLAYVDESGTLLVKTLESGAGYHIADVGDYIIRGVKGESLSLQTRHLRDDL